MLEIRSLYIYPVESKGSTRIDKKRMHVLHAMSTCATDLNIGKLVDPTEGLPDQVPFTFCQISRMVLE